LNKRFIYLLLGSMQFFNSLVLSSVLIIINFQLFSYKTGIKKSHSL